MVQLLERVKNILLTLIFRTLPFLRPKQRSQTHLSPAQPRTQENSQHAQHTPTKPQQPPEAPFNKHPHSQQATTVPISTNQPTPQRATSAPPTMPNRTSPSPEVIHTEDIAVSQASPTTTSKPSAPAAQSKESRAAQYALYASLGDAEDSAVGGAGRCACDPSTVDGMARLSLSNKPTAQHDHTTATPTATETKTPPASTPATPPPINPPALLRPATPATLLQNTRSADARSAYVEVVYLDGFVLDPGLGEFSSSMARAPTGYSFREWRARVERGEYESG